MFRFHGRATGSDPEGYYIERWDKAKKISVLAETRDEATEKAWGVLGIHSRYGRKSRGDGSGWTLIWDSMEEESNE